MSERYELKGKIGEGGIGTVHKAFDTQLKREVAIKRLIPVEGGNSAEAAENLIKEATTLSALQHPNIVTVYDVGKDEQGGFVVMELLKGETFDETINRGALTEGDFRNVVTQTLEALIAAHHTGLIHRDLKPSNLMVNWMPSGKFQIKILDFGLAKFSKQPSVQTIDQGDAILGSIYFMAPEQFERIALDARTDLYSMGCMYYQCLTGNYPFDGETAPMVMASHLQNRVTPLAQLRPDLPEWMCNWVMWLISRKMEDRPESAKFAYEQFNAEKSSPTQEAEAAALAAAAAVTAQQQAAPPAAIVAPTPAHAPPGYGTTQALGAGVSQPLSAGNVPMSMAPKLGFPKWALITIPCLIALVVIVAVMKFGGRGERKAKEALMVKLHEQIENEEVPTGNRATVETVIDYMLEHSSNTDTTNSAIRILGALEGDGVDGAIADGMEKVKSSRQRQGMIYTLVERNYRAGVPTLMKYVTSKDKEVQTAALSSVAQLGGREQLSKLVELAVESIEEGEGDGKPYRDYIVQIARGIPDKDARTKEIRAAAEKLDGRARGAMMEMLAPLGGDAALKLVKNALSSSDKDVKIATLRGLGNWPDSQVTELLFEAASDKSDPGAQLVAINSYSLNVARPSPLSTEQKLSQLREIFPQIEKSRQKKMPFYALGGIVDPAAIKLADELAEEDPGTKKFAAQAKARIQAALPGLAKISDKGTLNSKTGLFDAYLLKFSDDPKMLAAAGWTHPEDRIYWPIKFQSAGTYKVEVTQSAKEKDKDRYEITVAGAKLQAEVKPTGGDAEFETVDIGEISIDEPGTFTLMVSPLGIKGEELMNLKRINLTKK